MKLFGSLRVEHTDRTTNGGEVRTGDLYCGFVVVACDGELDPSGSDQACDCFRENWIGFERLAELSYDGFAVLRDPIACKPAVLAETDDWVAMASEWRAIAVLPGASDAQMWEPEPSVVYAWEKALV